MACTDKATDVYTLPAGLPAMDATPSRRRLPLRGRRVAHRGAGDDEPGRLRQHDRERAVGLLDLSLRLSHAAQHAGCRRPAGRRRQRGLPARARTSRSPARRSSVWAHGSVGIAPKCAPTHDRPHRAGPRARFPGEPLQARRLRLHRGRARLRRLLVRTAAGILQRRGRGALDPRRHARRRASSCRARRTRW